jgi:hypothetical protein
VKVEVEYWCYSLQILRLNSTLSESVDDPTVSRDIDYSLYHTTLQSPIDKMGNAHGTAAYAQIFSASISFISSLTIATAIVRSDGGLTSPFRRLIFGLSLSDVLLSFGLIVGPFASPASDISPFGLGNQGTCSAQGFILHLSGYTVPMYTCALSYY